MRSKKSEQVKKVRGHITETDPDCSILKKEEKPVLRLDIACGNNKKEGFLGVDISPDTQADFLCDLDSFKWQLMFIEEDVKDSALFNKNLESFLKKYGEFFNPDFTLKDNSVYEIHCSHYIEHTSDLKSFMEEIYRVLIPGGRVTFYAPYYSSIRAMQDFAHKRFISESTFLYFNKAWMVANKLEHYGVKCDFAILSIKFLFSKEWNTRSDQAKEWARIHNINVVNDIEINLQAIKKENVV